MSEDKLNKILEVLEELNKRVSNIEKNLVIKPQLNSEIIQKQIRGESFMEFFKKYHPEKETDKTLVIMHFLETSKNVINITSKDISEGFKEVREKIPSNVADKIQMLHKNGLIMPGENVNNLKGWLITRTGLEFLEKLKNESQK